MRISDWSSDVCSSDLVRRGGNLVVNEFIDALLSDLRFDKVEMMGMRGPNAWSLHHARSADLWGYMLCAGKACFTVEGQNQFDLSAGDVVVVPAGAEHGIRSVGSPAAELSYAHYSYDERRADRKSTRLNSSH